MNYRGWLVVTATKGRYGARALSVRLLTKEPRSLKPTEVAVELNLSLPTALFVRPRIATTITIPDDAIPTQIINEAIIGDIRDAVRQVTEMDVSVRLVSQDDLSVPGVPEGGDDGDGDDLRGE